MAIIFNTPIPTNTWITSNNNIITTFNALAGTGVTPLFCEISVAGLNTLRIYPMPDLSFWVNLSDYISNSLNDYVDDIDFNVTDVDINDYVRDWSKVIFSESITFKVTYSNDSTESVSVVPNVVLGGESVIAYKEGNTVTVGNVFLLMPKYKGYVYARYWEGLPFDFAISKNTNSLINSTLLINLTSQGNENATIDNIFNANRLIVSNGINTIETYFSLFNGINDLLVDNLSFKLIKETEVCDGVYLKWINQYGGYSYWLFNRFYSAELKTKDKGQINNDFSNIANTNSPYKQLGKESFETRTLYYDSANAEDVSVLRGLFTSPKIYLYTGVRGSLGTQNDWLEIKVSSSNVTLKEPKQDLIDIEFNIELPNDYNISL